MGLISISKLSARAHICSVYQLVEVAVCRLRLTAPPLIDLACWSLPCLSLAPPSPSPGGLSGPFYIGIHITLKRSPPCRLSNRPSHRLGLLVAVVSPAGSPVAIAGRVV